MAKTAVLPDSKSVNYYFDEHGFLRVPSKSTPGKFHTVTSGGCSCPRAEFSQNPCWHVLLREKLRDDIVAAMVAARVPPKDIRREVGTKFPELLEMPQEYWTGE